MKAALALLVLVVSFSSSASDDVDFVCVTDKENDTLEVSYEGGILKYNNDRDIEVAVASKTNDGKFMKVSGLAKGLVFAGGGTQSVSVKVHLKTKKGIIRIYTKTFYRINEINEDINCSI